MAELVITAANLHLEAGATVRLVQAGEAIDPGEGVYLHTDAKYYLALNDTALHAALKGVAVSYAPAAGDWFVIDTAGNLDIGAVVALGEIYVVASTAGKFELLSDLVSTEYITEAFKAVATDEVKMSIDATGARHA